VSKAVSREWVDYDARIVRVGQEVCQRLNVSFRLSAISWRKSSPFLRLGSDDCYFVRGRGKLAVPWWMRGRLEPEEWRPLMTSSLIYNRRLIWTMPADLVMVLLATFILLLAGAVLFYPTFGALGFLVYLFILFGPFLQQRFSQVRKNLKLKADREASRLVGIGAFLGVLEKIDSLGMKDVEWVKRRGLSRYFSSKPSTTERILNLRNVDDPAV
jgi:hypothetical protein